MFGEGKKPKANSSKVDTIIGQQTRIEGDVQFAGGLHVDGHIKGNIVAEAGSASVLTVSENGTVEGDVRVPTVILQAADDPFLPASALPQPDELSPAVTLELSPHGGHVGFITGTRPFSPVYWLEQRILELLAGHPGTRGAAP